MNTLTVHAGNVTIGGGDPIVVQTMCNTHTSDVEASFDSNGKITNIRVVQSNHSGLVAPAIEAAQEVLQSKTFKPATMDNHAVSGSIIFPILCEIKPVSPSKL